jgi:hypothetical protein
MYVITQAVASSKCELTVESWTTIFLILSIKKPFTKHRRPASSLFPGVPFTFEWHPHSATPGHQSSTVTRSSSVLLVLTHVVSRCTHIPYILATSYHRYYSSVLCSLADLTSCPPTLHSLWPHVSNGAPPSPDILLLIPPRVQVPASYSFWPPVPTILLLRLMYSC